jgi:hypothetical protein
MSWNKRHVLRSIVIRLPILKELSLASWPNWREAFKELFLTLFFSLMSLWLGIFVVNFLKIASGTSNFLHHFASSSDLGILSASLLGPLLYMMFREEGQSTGNRLVPSFPSGLWFIMIILTCCILATVIYSFTYLSETRLFYDKDGSAVDFVNSNTVAFASWILLATVSVVILFAATIRNSTETQPPRMMSDDTQAYVDKFEAAQSVPNDAEDFTAQFAAAQGENK